MCVYICSDMSSTSETNIIIFKWPDNMSDHSYSWSDMVLLDLELGTYFLKFLLRSAPIPQHKVNYICLLFYTYYALTLQYCAGQYTSQTCFIRKLALYGSFGYTFLCSGQTLKYAHSSSLNVAKASCMYSWVLYSRYWYCSWLLDSLMSKVTGESSIKIFATEKRSRVYQPKSARVKQTS